MKLTDYVPKLYENNIEMKNLTQSEEDEFEIYLKFDIDEAFLNQFIKSADKNGIKQYEEILDLKPDANFDNLDYRRARVVTKLITRAPLSVRWLEQSLTSLVRCK